MKITKRARRRLPIILAAVVILAALTFFLMPEKTPDEVVMCSRSEDCELYQCANCANKDEIDDDERGNEGCNQSLKVSCSCIEGVCRREYK